MKNTNAGLTLIEVLVATSLLAITLTLSTLLLSGLQLTPKTNQTLTVTQASARWLETANTIWARAASYGDLSVLPAVPTIANTTWSATACTVSPQTGTATCGAAVTSGLPRYSGGGSTVASTVQLVRLNLTYTPVRPGTTTASGQATTTTLEVVRP